ncbi:hypothetical protein GUF51_00765, partial [Xanthomonas citri pv. citri]|nr:hypothetical protein [Xanthomonas citri pv. citri]
TSVATTTKQKKKRGKRGKRRGRHRVYCASDGNDSNSDVVVVDPSPSNLTGHYHQSGEVALERLDTKVLAMVFFASAFERGKLDVALKGRQWLTRR